MTDAREQNITGPPTLGLCVGGPVIKLMDIIARLCIRMMNIFKELEYVYIVGLLAHFFYHDE